MYVAITRAKQFLHMSYSDVRSNYGQQERCQRSQFLNEIPVRLFNVNFDENQSTYKPPKKKMQSQPVSSTFMSGKSLLNLSQNNRKR